MNHNLFITSLLTATAVLPAAAQKTAKAKPATPAKQPNILFVISDDQSYPYASAYGNNTARTPGFDRVAGMGILFNNAYVTSPGSAPSRASILTGRYPWQNREAGTHASDFPRDLHTYPEMLQAVGYHIGHTGKGWGPGQFAECGWPWNPAGPAYSDITWKPPYKGILNNDYAANFEAFMKDRKAGQPFCFWFGAKEPHRAYEQDSHVKEGRDKKDALVPEYLPDTDLVRGDLLDYGVEIESYDKHLVRMLDYLEKIGELDNTIILCTSDNGMPFPRSKGSCYDQGIHVPFAVAWRGGGVPAGIVSDDLVSMVDLAPTFVEIAGAKHMGDYPFVGKSLMPLFRSAKNGYTRPADEQWIYAARERHSSSRYNNWGYPQRLLRFQNVLYVRNFHPERWPAGDPTPIVDAQGTLGTPYSAFNDIDRGPTIDYLKENYTDPTARYYLDLATAKRPYEEFFDLSKDPYGIKNLIADPEYQSVIAKVRGMMDKTLKTTGDTRVVGDDPEVWESYPRHSDIRYYPNPETGEIPAIPAKAFSGKKKSDD